MTSLLPFPELQFLDGNGVPLAGGSVQTLVPGSFTPKQTWQDALQIVSNSNPITLSGAGRATIYGEGIYRFIVKDQYGNLQYDQITSSTQSEVASTEINTAVVNVLGYYDVQSATFAGGADPNGIQDCTAAIQSAINAAAAADGGGIVFFRPGKYSIGGTLNITSSAVVLQGAGQFSTKLVFNNGASNCIIVAGVSWTDTISGVRILDLSVIGQSKTEGRAVVFQYAEYSFIERVFFSNMYLGIESCSCNTITIRDVLMQGVLCSATGWFGQPGWAIYFHTDGVNPNIVLNLDNVIINCLYSGSDGIRWDGAAGTLNSYATTVLESNIGLRVINSAPSNTQYPQYGEFVTFTTDGATNYSVYIAAGNNFMFTNCNLQNTSGESGQGSADINAVCILPDNNPSTGSYTRECYFVNCLIGMCKQSAVSTGGRNVTFIGCRFGSGEHTPSNTYPAIEVTGSAIDTMINDCWFSYFGAPNNWKYGIQIDSGAVRTTSQGCSFAVSCLTGPYLNNSGDSATYVNLGTGLTLWGGTGRNMIHNPLMNIAQRGNGPFTSGYSLDRWYVAVITDSASVTRVTLADADRTAIGDESAEYALQNVFAGSNSAGAYTEVIQTIEDCRRTANKTVTVSFWAKAASGTPSLYIQGTQYFGTGGSPSAGVACGGSIAVLSTTWARYSATLTVPSAAGKTLGTNNNHGLQIILLYSAQGWLVQSGTIQVWGVQAEINPAASPLEKPDPRYDLSNCQRFFTVLNLSWDSYANGAGSSFPAGTFTLPTAMRIPPTVSPSGITYSSCSAITVGTTTTNSIALTVTTAGAVNYNVVYTAACASDM